MSTEPTKAMLLTEIRTILKDANLEVTTSWDVRQQLEQNLQCNLTARRKKVDNLVMEYVNSHASDDENDDNDDEDEEEIKGDHGWTSEDSNEDGNHQKNNVDDDHDDPDEDESEDNNKAKNGADVAAAKSSRETATVGGRKRKTTESELEETAADDWKQAKKKGTSKRGRSAGSTKGPRKPGGRNGSTKGPRKPGGRNGSTKGPRKPGGRNGSTKGPTKPGGRNGSTKGPRKPGGRNAFGLFQPCTLSPELAALCGAEQLTRYEIVKKVWAVIKDRNLYDPKNKQYAICDTELFKVIGIRRFRMFGMLQYLKKHFVAHSVPRQGH